VDPVPRPGWVWAALSELHPQTGLVPILLDGLPGDTLRLDSQGLAGLPRDRLRPWDSGEFYLPEDPREADGLDVGALLENLWRGSVWADEDDPEAMEQWAPFTLEWPGLAPPGSTPLTPAERQRALDVVLPRIRLANSSTPDARIGLVAAARPADVLAVIGWDALVPRAPGTPQNHVKAASGGRGGWLGGWYSCEFDRSPGAGAQPDSARHGALRL